MDHVVATLLNLVQVVADALVQVHEIVGRCVLLLAEHASVRWVQDRGLLHGAWSV